MRLNRAELATAALATSGLAILYALIAFVIPFDLSAPIVDEPIFAVSAFEFARSGELAISNLSAPNGVFDAIWGGTFVTLLGESYESLRWSSLALTAISVPFMYWLCRTMRASRGIAVLGAAAYLFAPLAMVMSFTYHTDPHTLSLIVIALALNTSALRGTSISNPLLLLASFASALAFLSRPQALVVPIAALLALGLRHRIRKLDIKSVLAVALLPLSAFLLHMWFTSHAGEPFIREISQDSLFSRSFEEIASLTSQALVMFPIYVGLFVLPLTPLLMSSQVGGHHKSRNWKLVLIAALASLGLGLVISGQGAFDQQQWLSHSGLGGVDRSHLGSRPDLLGPIGLAALTAVLLVSAYKFFTSFVTRQIRLYNLERVFLLWVVAGFTGAALLSSLALQGRIFDRYWLPILPAVIALAVPAAASRFRTVLSTALTMLLALFSVLGTYDAFVFYDTVNRYSDAVIASGVDPERFDGGASWSAATFGLHDESPGYLLDRRGPYWIKIYAVRSDPELGVALRRLKGYSVIESVPYESVLHMTPTELYLVRPAPGENYFQSVEDF